MIQYSVGMSLGPSSSVESGVAVREIATGKLIYVDKLFSMSDVQLFFDNYSSIQNSVFCISLKAGGTGLNLTGADIVIHYDPWWNVAVENQATDRAHRIGQKNVVTVYKLIAKGTIEEKIIKLQQMKKELAEEILSGDEIKTASFQREELLELLEERF